MSAGWHALMRSREPWASLNSSLFRRFAARCVGLALVAKPMVKPPLASYWFISILIEYASTTATHSALIAMSLRMALEHRA